MARHKARSWRVSTLIAAALMAGATVLVSVVGVGSAGAVTSPGMTVNFKDSVVTGHCGFTLESVNPSNGTAQVRVGAAAQPTSLLGYATNAYTQVFCGVLDPNGNVLTEFAPFTNHPVLFNQGETPTIALEPHYTLCGLGLVKLSNGGTDVTPEVCKTS